MAESPLWSSDQRENGWAILSSLSCFYLSYKLLEIERSFLTNIRRGEAMARRRKEDRRAGIASRGMVRRWGRFSSCVRHRGVSDRERAPEWCHSSGAAVDACGDAPAEAQRAEHVADGGVVNV